MARRLVISSGSNPRLKALRRLVRKPSPTTCFADGARALGAALDNGRAVRELYVAPTLLTSRAQSLVAEAERRGAEIIEVAAAAFTGLVTAKRPDGLLAVLDRPTTDLAALALPPDPLITVAVGIERPGNLGAIARTAAASAAHALIVADPRTDTFHRDVVRGSVGTIFSLQCATASTSAAIDWLRANGVRVLVATPQARTPYWDVRYDGPTTVVFGSERHGLPAAWLQAADDCVTIPMPGTADSLNVAVAAGVILAEAVRRRHSAALIYEAQGPPSATVPEL